MMLLRPWARSGSSTISMTLPGLPLSIYQPRRENVSTWTITVEQLMDWAEHTLKPKAEMAYQGEGRLCSWPLVYLLQGRR